MARRLRDILTDVALGAARGYATGAQSDIPEVGLVQGALGGFDTARTLGEERRKMANRIRIPKRQFGLDEEGEFEFESGKEAADALRGSKKKRQFVGMQGGKAVMVDEGGNFSFQDLPSKEPIKPKTEKPLTSPSHQRFKQTQFVDSSDNVPLAINESTGGLVRTDTGSSPRGNIITLKGNQEATQSASRAAEVLPKIDILFDALEKRSGLGARLAMTPGVNVMFPEERQLRAEIKQVGFTFGGKNFTGTEESIITDALIPGPFDNDASREAKRKALKGYVSGQINLLQAANLLGPAGNKIKTIVQPDSTKQIEENSFASEQEAEAAEQAGQLKKGDRVIIDGVSGTWQ